MKLTNDELCTGIFYIQEEIFKTSNKIHYFMHYLSPIHVTEIEELQSRKNRLGKVVSFLMSQMETCEPKNEK